MPCCKAIHTRGVFVFSSISVIRVRPLLPFARLLPEYGDPLIVVVDDSLLVVVKVLDEGELKAGRRPLQPLQFYVLPVGKSNVRLPMNTWRSICLCNLNIECYTVYSPRGPRRFLLRLRLKVLHSHQFFNGQFIPTVPIFNLF